MPYPQQTMLFQWGGNVRGASSTQQVLESFTGSMRFAAPEGPNDIRVVDNDAAMLDLLEDLRSFWQNPDSQIPGNYRIEWCKWNRIDVDGHYVGDTTRQVFNLNYDGGGGAIVYPLQIAWASTWMTDKSRGLANKGRTYWPTRAVISSGDMLVPEGTCQKFAQNCQTLIDNWGNWNGVDTSSVVPVIASKQRGGAIERITGVRVGRRLDILRSRAAQLSETKYIGPTG